MKAYKSPEHALTSAQQFLLLEQNSDSHLTKELALLISSITLASKHIALYVKRDGLTDVSEKTNSKNVHGEEVKKLDELADKMLINSLGLNADVAIVSSEENENPVILRESGGKYILFFDPLDGSSNLSSGIAVGTIFSIMEKSKTTYSDPMEIILQPGNRQIAAGYIMYGSSTVLVFTTGKGVHMFTLDPNVGDYLLSRQNMTFPDNGKCYSINEGNAHSFDPGYNKWLDWVKSNEAGPYTGRYIGSMVADFHRTLIQGGVFAYPATKKSPEGKLRLMYEANPIAFIAEQAKGMATNGKSRILDIQPTSLHQRVPLLFGEKKEVEKIMSYIN
ncbi:MAG: class 1 fructose-bisphosphatase [Spirochaetia bacterium]|nr:class 1 fructose-bisphosphatase [Spirochaetia bacterium]